MGSLDASIEPEETMSRYTIDARMTPEPLALPLVAIMAGSDDLILSIRERLTGNYGPLLASSETFLFDSFTGYYKKEFGEGMRKQVCIFRNLREQRLLPGDKHASCAIERELTLRENDCRPVNIDPGFMTLSKLVLASTKDHAHRLYLGTGIYGEITLAWKGHAFVPLPWSYPDYVSLIPFLVGVRNRLQTIFRETDTDPALIR